MNHRGIVVTSSFRTVGSGEITSPIPATHLRRYALYWDKITLAQATLEGGGGIFVGLNIPDVVALQQAGVLTIQETIILDSERPHFFFPPNEQHPNGMALMPPTSVMYPIAQRKVADFLNRTTNTLWSIGQCGEGLLLCPRKNTTSDFLEIKLYDALPVPSGDTPIEAILEFKQKRSSELLQMRHSMDQLHDFVTKSDDIQRARTVVMEKVDIALRDIHKTLNESKIKKITSSISLYIGTSQSALISAAIGTIGASNLGISAELGALIAVGVNAFVTFTKQQFQNTVDISDASKNFVYLYHLQKQKSLKFLSTDQPDDGTGSTEDIFMNF